MFLPIRAKNPPESFPFVTCSIIALNVLVYAATSNGLSVHPEVLPKLALTLENFSPLTILTSMFLHANLEHLLGNMWFLYVFGFAVEGRLRWWKFSLLYLGSGVTADLLDLLMEGMAHPTVPSLGASGAIMGVIGAALYMFPFADMDIFILWWQRLLYGDSLIVIWPLWAAGLYFVGFDVLLALLSRGGPGDGVAHFAHIGGVAGGFLLCMILRPKRDSRIASQAKSSYVETNDLTLCDRVELEEIARSNPDDPHVTLTWMQRCLKDNRIDPICRDSFFRILPRMLKEQPAGAVGSCLLMLNNPVGQVPCRTVMEAASACERSHDGEIAARLYDYALVSPDLTQSDQEMALFRLAMVCERNLIDFPRAINLYREVEVLFPMSPFADQARTRLKALNAPAV